MIILIINDDKEGAIRLRRLFPSEKVHIIPDFDRYADAVPTPEQILQEAIKFVDINLANLKAAIIDLHWKKGDYAKDYGYNLIYYIRNKGSFLPIFVVSLYSEKEIREKLHPNDSRCDIFAGIPDLRQLKNRLLEAESALQLPNQMEAIISYYQRKYEEISRSDFIGKAKQHLSLLKHRIAHNFLSIDIDLQGIAETEEERRIDYLLDMFLVEKEGNFEWRNVGHYQEKLKLAQSYVLKSKIGKKRESGKELNTIEEIYEYALEAESDEEKKGEINRRWKKVKELAKGENELYKNIIAILKDLDDAVDEVRNNFSIRSKEKEKIIEEASEIIENNSDKFHKLNQIIQKVKSEKFSEFHKWFIELDDSIDKLREALRG